MVETLAATLMVGTLLGFLSGIGVGGGSLLVLWLTLIRNTPAETARCINLLFFLPGALIASCFRWKQGCLDLKSILPAVLSACLFASLFSRLGRHGNPSLLTKCFGILMIVTGLRELFFQTKKRS